ncbi:MAG: ABA4-like family protein [Verrucomicrobiota bacterium]
MTPEQVFSIASNIALPSWLYLLAAARWTPKTFAVVKLLIPATLSLIYLLSVITAYPLQGGFSSLSDVANLFSDDWALLAGWVHYLAFDFFVGCWILEQAKKRAIPHWLLVPILIFTFLLGPIGYLLFQALTAVSKKPITA